MTIPARLLADYVTPEMAPIEVHYQDGSLAYRADLRKLNALIAGNSVYGIGSKRRLRRVVLLVPMEVAEKRCADQCEPPATTDPLDDLMVMVQGRKFIRRQFITEREQLTEDTFIVNKTPRWYWQFKPCRQ